jgi:hypothetical protein
MAKKTNTSIIPVTVIEKAEDDAALMTKQAVSIRVTTIEQEEQAHTALVRIKHAIKTIEDKRKEITKPLNTSIKVANEMFRNLSEPFIVADKIIRNKIMEFRQVQEEKAQKELERRQKIQDAHAVKGHEIHGIVVPGVKVSRETTVAVRWTYSVIDIDKVPREFLVLDSVAVNKAIRNGIREVSGLSIYQVEGLRV